MSEILLGDCLQVMGRMEDKSVDLVFGSPPYEDARTYGIDFNLKGQEWVDWMVKVYRESLRICRGLVAFVVAGKTRQYKWSCTPALLVADLHRAGFNVRNPPLYHRVGIPGSGGPDWLRSDYEWIVCVSHPGRLPWSDNVAMGHPPKWGPGGEMSHRLSDGARVNQWGGSEGKTRYGRKQDGSIDMCKRPSHKYTTIRKTVTSGYADGDIRVIQKDYVPPVKANPGNVIGRAVIGGMLSKVGRADGATPSHGGRAGTVNPDGTITRKDGSIYVGPGVANPGNMVSCGSVGGGHLGSKLAHENEAPFPESLAEFMIRSFCRPGGIVLDPFCGSGTTLAVAAKWGRIGIGIDVRESQVELTKRRLASCGALSENS